MQDIDKRENNIALQITVFLLLVEAVAASVPRGRKFVIIEFAESPCPPNKKPLAPPFHLA